MRNHENRVSREQKLPAGERFQERRAFASNEVEWSNLRMPNISRIRSEKMIAQGGFCYYCGLPMWDNTSSASFKSARGDMGSLPQLRCTAEHLRPRSEGGKDVAENIVAACLYCNRSRHLKKKPRSPVAHRDHVRKRMAAGRWLVPLVSQGGEAYRLRERAVTFETFAFPSQAG